jgi:hypothetical protein
MRPSPAGVWIAATAIAAAVAGTHADGLENIGTEVTGSAATALEFERHGVAGPAAAAWIRSLEDALARVRRPELVWTGPEVPGLHARDTRRVYEELLGTAESSVWASTFAFFDGPRAFEVLARRIDERSELRVTLLLNIQRRRGDTTVSDHLVRRFADRFWKGDWPGARRPAVFYDPRALEPDGPAGVLHAKAVVTDDESVFLPRRTSRRLRSTETSRWACSCATARSPRTWHDISRCSLSAVCSARCLNHEGRGATRDRRGHAILDWRY